jgi:hypothetical protein
MATILLISVGFLWISFHLIIRFVIERFPYKLYENVTSLNIFIAFVLLFVHIAIFIMTMYKIIMKPLHNNNSILLKIQNFIYNCYYKPLIKIHDNIIRKLPYSGYVWEDIGNTLVWYLNNRTRKFMFMCLLEILPRMVVSTAFLIDIVVYNQFAYFYIVLVLLIVPLTYKAFVYILQAFGSRNCLVLEECLIVKQESNGDYIFKVSPFYSHDAITLNIEKNHWLMLNSIRHLMDSLTSLGARYIPYALIYTSSCYILGWIFYLHYVNISDFLIIIKPYLLLLTFSLCYHSLIYIKACKIKTLLRKTLKKKTPLNKRNFKK